MATAIYAVFFCMASTGQCSQMTHPYINLAQCQSMVNAERQIYGDRIAVLGDVRCLELDTPAWHATPSRTD